MGIEGSSDIPSTWASANLIASNVDTTSTSSGSSSGTGTSAAGAGTETSSTRSFDVTEAYRIIMTKKLQSFCSSTLGYSSDTTTLKSTKTSTTSKSVTVTVPLITLTSTSNINTETISSTSNINNITTVLIPIAWTEAIITHQGVSPPINSFSKSSAVVSRHILIKRAAPTELSGYPDSIIEAACSSAVSSPRSSTVTSSTTTTLSATLTHTVANLTIYSPTVEVTTSTTTTTTTTMTGNSTITTTTGGPEVTLAQSVGEGHISYLSDYINANNPEDISTISYMQGDPDNGMPYFSIGAAGQSTTNLSLYLLWDFDMNAFRIRLGSDSYPYYLSVKALSVSTTQADDYMKFASVFDPDREMVYFDFDQSSSRLSLNAAANVGRTYLTTCSDVATGIGDVLTFSPFSRASNLVCCNAVVPNPATGITLWAFTGISHIFPIPNFVRAEKWLEKQPIKLISRSLNSCATMYFCYFVHYYACEEEMQRIFLILFQ
ncbi:hypothetical protein ABW20_dc0100225 [Dactylellina cionopaga]|nr:hypothetical protein ABW20_dc0100225 [Dactylellina cionopaga]